MKGSKSHLRLSPPSSLRSVSLHIRETLVTAKVRTPIPVTTRPGLKFQAR
jgi:hypothetical protein